MAATDIKNLKKKNIKAVVTCAIDLDVKLTQSFEHIVLEIEDSDKQDIYSLFEKFNQILHENLLKGSVLVHCAAGVYLKNLNSNFNFRYQLFLISQISRSAALCLAFIMKKKKWDFRTSLSYLKSKRFVVNPNMGFVKQLKRYEKILGKKIEDDELLEKIQKQNLQTLDSLQTEIMIKEKSKNIQLDSNQKDLQNQKTQTKKPLKTFPRKVASAQQGFRLADLVSLDKKDESNQSQNNNRVLMQNQIKYKKQIEQKQIAQKYYGLNTFYKNNNKVDINNLNKNKFKDNDFDQITKQNVKQPYISNMGSSKNLKNSQQKLQLLTGKLLKEEQELAYNKFEYKPRFRRLSSAISKENCFLENGKPKSTQNKITSEQKDRFNQNQQPFKTGNQDIGKKNSYISQVNQQQNEKQNRIQSGGHTYSFYNKKMFQQRENQQQSQFTLARHQKQNDQKLQKKKIKQVNFEDDQISDSLLDDFQIMEQQLMGSQIDMEFNIPIPKSDRKIKNYNHNFNSNKHF
ncbi:hypothetical protein PPERSA_05840 [Pseudocohnilembus persalinus]|uniref:protein-tyrosine-phosphatase n=1 Tax=Pseudocohnilembus persalinus TaxID=266149 RepID=A0A0V0R3W1_PSEPJ|nr:hypothetical protein PPERSA_05840 [Pseudocohnilembus persalinus]|eukprot:KRX09171.1 hypothetical protein PPERSA_05840 [Pseudocohnilembus persalinus]